MLRILLVLVVSLAAGCAHRGARQDELNAAWEAAEAACDRHYADLRSGILGRVLPDARTRAEPSPEMLANARKPTELEKAAVRRRTDAFLKCSSEHRRVFATFGTVQHVAIFDGFVDARLRGLIDLYNGDLTYAEFLRAGQHSSQELRAAISMLDDAFETDDLQVAIRVQQEYLQKVGRSSSQRRAAACLRDGAYEPC